MEIPGYRIQQQIGQSDMATVYLATQTLLGRVVALKVMNADLAGDTYFASRFRNQSRIPAQLLHPRIITLFDVGRHNEHYYCSMEFLSGGSLNEKISHGIPADQALLIVRQIAEALDYAHGRGIVHGNLKPQNILFRTPEDPVLTDFGLASVTAGETRSTPAEMAIDSRRYMSPEQIDSGTLDSRSDLYSLGILLYQMLTGELPDQADHVETLAVGNGSSPPPTLPASFADYQPIINQLLSKNPEDRFENCEALIRALDPFLPPQAIDSVEPPSMIVSGFGRISFRDR